MLRNHLWNPCIWLTKLKYFVHMKQDFKNVKNWFLDWCNRLPSVCNRLHVFRKVVLKTESWCNRLPTSCNRLHVCRFWKNDRFEACNRLPCICNRLHSVKMQFLWINTISNSFLFILNHCWTITLLHEQCS